MLKKATKYPYELEKTTSLKFFWDRIKRKKVPAKKIINPRVIITE